MFFRRCRFRFRFRFFPALSWEKITEIKEKTVMLDVNHPMAGKELNFEIQLVEIADEPSYVAPETVEPPTEPIEDVDGGEE